MSEGGVVTAPAELTAFVRREHPRLVRAVHLLLDDHAVAEEVAQEALLRAASRWEQVSTMDSPGGWTHRVAINLATSQLRRRRIERRARSRMSRDGSGSVPDTATAVTVRAALQALPETHRRVLVLRHVLDWTTAEIADLDGVGPDAIRQRLHRARAAMREQLGPELHIDDPDSSSPVTPLDTTARTATAHGSTTPGTTTPGTTTPGTTDRSAGTAELSLDVEETTDAR
jgi:RNA polymerase sigma-70 factor, ECF subfamily